jgi:hypothetical protein
MNNSATSRRDAYAVYYILFYNDIGETRKIQSNLQYTYFGYIEPQNTAENVKYQINDGIAHG